MRLRSGWDQVLLRDLRGPKKRHGEICEALKNTKLSGHFGHPKKGVSSIHTPTPSKPAIFCTREGRGLHVSDAEIDTPPADPSGEPWFVAADVCRALELDQPHRALTRIDEDEKGRTSITTPGGNQEMSIVNEPGLYSLVLGSRKAKQNLGSGRRVLRLHSVALGFEHDKRRKLCASARGVMCPQAAAK